MPEIVTRDGVRLTVRPIEPRDKPALLRAFEHLGEESRYRRFLAPIRRLKRGDISYFTEVDHSSHEALAAFTSEGEMVGVARYVSLDDRPGVAEVAVTIADNWQHRGIGTTLLHLLAKRAWKNGVRSLVGLCLADNQEMQELLRELAPGCRSRNLGEGLVELQVDLTQAPSREGVASAVRVAARGYHGGPGSRAVGAGRTDAEHHSGYRLL